MRNLCNWQTLCDVRTFCDVRTLCDGQTLHDVRTLPDVRTLHDGQTLCDVRTLCDVQMTLKLQPAWMVWKGELACLLGLVALLLLVIVGLASLPSVSASLNWAEWRLIQSRIGVVALFLAVAHVTAMGAPGWAKGGWGKTFRSITFLSGFLPAVTVLLRFVLALPPINQRLKKIRRGWERNSPHSDTFPLGSPSQLDRCCSSRKGILKKTSAAGGGRISRNPIYTAITVDQEIEDGCASCRDGRAHPSLPTRSCNCSVV